MPVHMAPCEWLEEGVLTSLCSHLSENCCELLILLDHNRCLPYAHFFIINSSKEPVNQRVWQWPLPGDAVSITQSVPMLSWVWPVPSHLLCPQTKCNLCHSPLFMMISTHKRLPPSDHIAMRFLSKQRGSPCIYSTRCYLKCHSGASPELQGSLRKYSVYLFLKL